MAGRVVHAGVLLLLVLSFAPRPSAQAPPPQDDAAIEQFMRTAKIVRSRGTSKGITGSLRVTLSDGQLTHDVHVQKVDEAKMKFETAQGVEFNFRDSWRFNLAAYRIDRLLDLQLVPPTIERRYQTDPAAFTWWVDDVQMDEAERLRRKQEAPDVDCWNAQMRLVRVFDQLIDNTDRNLGNLLITGSWRIWAIDHTRAFRQLTAPRQPANLTHIDRATLDRLKSLDEASVRRAVGNYIGGDDIRNLLRRRDAIVAHFASAGSSALFERSAICRASGK